MKTEAKRWVLVTGASSGIGRATTEFLAKRGFGVYGCARRKEDLEALGRLADVVAIPLDVRSDVDAEAARDRIAGAGTGLFAVVNNAGIARGGPLLDVSTEELREQFEVNFFGVHRVTRALLPLVVHSKGRVVLMSSDSGFFAKPFFGPYCASKFALEGYADSLRREVCRLGVSVVLVQPGRIATPIWDKGEEQLARSRDGSTLLPLARKVGRYAIDRGKRTGIAPVEVARVVHLALVARKPRARYLVARERWEYRLIRLLPSRAVDWLVAKEIGRIERSAGGGS